MAQKIFDNDWLNLSEAATVLGVHPTTLRIWADHGDIVAHRTPGNHRRFLRSEVEALSVLKAESPAVLGQQLVEQALDRVRLQAMEGRLRAMTWYGRFDDTQLGQLREAGRRLLSALTQALGSPTPATAEEARAIGREYQRLGRAAGLTLGETVEVFLFFREFLYTGILEAYRASEHRRGAAWMRLHERVSSYTNMTLVALVNAGLVDASGG